MPSDFAPAQNNLDMKRKINSGLSGSLYARRTLEHPAHSLTVQVKNSPPVRVKKMKEKRKKEEIAFGMTMEAVAKTADALSKHTDNNHPSKTGSYSDFLEVKNIGHKELLKQENYGKINN